MTPAQAYGHPNFVDDVPVQGPTDQGMRALACLYARTRLPHPATACVECEGLAPMWTSQSLSIVRGNNAGLGDSLALAGCGGAPCWSPTGLQGASDPAVDPGFATEQLAWVQNALLTLNDKIMATSGSSCPTWADPTAHMGAAVGCFQAWWNTHYAGAGKPGVALRTDGVLDEDTLCGLQAVAQMHPTDFPTPFPDPKKQFCQSKKLAHAHGKGLVARWEALSTPAKIGIGVAAGAAVGGVAYAVVRHNRKKR